MLRSCGVQYDGVGSGGIVLVVYYTWPVVSVHEVVSALKPVRRGSRPRLWASSRCGAVPRLAWLAAAVPDRRTHTGKFGTLLNLPNISALHHTIY